VVAVAAAAALALGIGGCLLAGAGRHGAGTARAAGRTPAPVITTATSTWTAPPGPTPSGHEGLRVRVPELGIDLPIVDGDGYDAPLYEAAHYPGTAWPGEGGRSVLYAHARAGMFGPLPGARAGQHILITGPGGSARTYVITEHHPRWPITDLSWLRPAGHEQVVLITCTTYHYDDPRVVTVGEPAT